MGLARQDKLQKNSERIQNKREERFLKKVSFSYWKALSDLLYVHLESPKWVSGVKKHLKK